ncbi:lipopolysaccharide biosynthesis protein [Rhodococcus oxybenzonivorans]|uniref:lipopolysaccharide biosynthesis protein n=1 Tax=Rhodococcus oxybenzonivorans TaxID=1990687 RepID=UPI002955C148|nr:lipopolysaccharide biosynthesis protein [Rhodococcus oxybenzonivorans]MDV7354470.1 lipopolysaccharide biosynthesis protein [Rhodococcus oxybenzonivorans]
MTHRASAPPDRGRLSSLSNSPSVIAASRLLVQLCPLLTAPVVARALGPEGRGYYAACFAAMILTPVVLGMGLPLVVRRRAANESAAPVLRSAYFVIPLAIPFAVGIGILVEKTLLSGIDPHTGMLYIVGMGCSVLFIGTLCIQSILIADQSYLYIAVVQSVQPISLTAGIVVGWIAGSLTLNWILVVAAISIFSSFVAGLALTRIPLQGKRESIPRMLREGVTYSGSQIAETANVTLIQVLAVGVIGAAETGFLAIAVTIAGLPLTIAHTVTAVIYKDAAAADRNSTLLSGIAIRVTVLATAVPTILLALLAPVAIPLIFGHAFVPAIDTTLIALSASVFLASGYVLAQILAAQNKGAWMTVNQLAGLVISVAFFFLLGPRFGANGAAIGLATGWLTATGLHVISLRVPLRLILPRPRDVKHIVAIVLLGRFDYETL